MLAKSLAFILERLRVQLRAEGARHDVLAAASAAGAEDDIVRLLSRTEEVARLLATDDGRDLLAAYKRAANILRIEDKKDGPHRGAGQRRASQNGSGARHPRGDDGVGCRRLPMVEADGFFWRRRHVGKTPHAAGQVFRSDNGQ